MRPSAILAIYAVAVVYAACMFLLGPWIPLATIVLGFGMLVGPYLAFEWVATPAVAVLMGVQARWWSVPAVLVLCSPAVVLFTIVTPVVGAGSEAMGVPVPWLAVYAKGKAAVLPVIEQRLLWWGGLHVAAMLAGWASRRMLPLATDKA